MKRQMEFTLKVLSRTPLSDDEAFRDLVRKKISRAEEGLNESGLFQFTFFEKERSDER